MSNKKIIIYTDGACSGNPGPGGWGAVLVFGEVKKEISGYEPLTTNNRMELKGAIEALKAIKNNNNYSVEVYTDSIYVKNGITEWIKTWKLNGWRSSGKKDVKNSDLWMELDDICSRVGPSWNWVKGHSTNELNNRADSLARLAIKNRL